MSHAELDGRKEFEFNVGDRTFGAHKLPENQSALMRWEVYEIPKDPTEVLPFVGMVGRSWDAVHLAKRYANVNNLTEDK